MARRPELVAPPEIFYGDEEARKYAHNSRMIEVQCSMAERCVELLMLGDDNPKLILDIGCGSGLSGRVLTASGHTWLGVDISPAMLRVARDRQEPGDFILGDMGQGMAFRAGAFDAAVSVSALQWLCNADSATHNPVKRLYTFFSSLFACLTRDARAVFQFYPNGAEQTELVASQAVRAGFGGGVLVDYPNSTKAKKCFLVLTTGGPATMPRALGVDDGEPQRVEFGTRANTRNGRANAKCLKKSKRWILEKKARQRRQGKETRPDTKYTGRKRSGRF